MGNITKKQIKNLLRDVRDELEEAIANKGEEQDYAGKQIEVDVKIELGEVPPIAPITLPSEKSIAFKQCFWFCYTIDGVRICKLYCY